MPAIFPGAVRVFTPKVDLVDTVMASHVNLLQDEMTAVQTTLGTGILSSSWLGSFAQPATHASVGARMANIEAGLRASSGVHGLTGSVVGTTDSQTLTGKTISGANNTLTNIAQSSVTSLTTDISAKANLSGATFTGNVNVVSPTAAGSTGARQITLSAADPSGGADGDVWIKYIA